MRRRGSRRLIIVRHAQSEANAIGSLHCTVPGPELTEQGREQAEKLVASLADEDVRSVWSSTMTRAQQTAEPLAAARELDLRVHDGFKESYLGDLHDRRDAEAHEAFDDVYASWLVRAELENRCPGGGESGAEVLGRWLGALDEVVVSLDDGAAVVVSHGAATRLAVSRLAQIEPTWALTHHLPNTGHIVLDEEDGRWACRSWGGLRPGL
ncbi:histidine phosphatase family protein [Cryptosporangium aurantiacum]|uniref:Probable phosphoglycerate mutase n=1 Tax=Cryptosporangium aurantiacum TaxID=134849 RepID=A0A1M7RPC6_9ACTN|nr:histidine phosphatase family protein [Cryptosporangium aurantiacum]SHN47956.1 probable phosphoglycerate mutase [Cryptosporangium aurantiacum]